LRNDIVDHFAQSLALGLERNWRLHRRGCSCGIPKIYAAF
jgi:hypothetical protein